MTKVNPKSGSETKSDTFPLDIFKSDIIFHWSYFSLEVYNWHFPISLQE